ncbi:hydrogen gas-evolving membrane-bound hydrogenase subunit E [Planctomycetota bacterium]
MKYLTLVIILFTGAALLYGVSDMPQWGDPNTPASIHVSPRYEQALEETGTPNLVTAVLADYRGYDTLGETTVIFLAGIACFLLLRKGKQDD